MAIHLKRNLNLLFWSHLLQSMFFMTPIITLFYLNRGLTYPELFIISMSFGIISFLFEIPTGMIADKIGRKWTIIIGVALYLPHHLIYFFAQGFWQIFIGFAMWVIGFAFLSGSVEAYIYDLLKLSGRVQDMKKEFGRYLSAKRVPSFILPFIGAWVAKDLLNWQFQTLIAISFFFALIALVLTLFLDEVKHSSKKEDFNVLLKDSWKLFISNSNFRHIFWNSVFVYIPFHIFWRIWQPYLLDYSVSVLVLGVIVATYNIICFFLLRHIHILEQKIGLERLIFLTVLFPFLGYLSLAISSSLWIAIIAMYLVFVLSISRRSLISDYLNSHIESRNRATALSMLNMLQGLLSASMMLLTAGLTLYYEYAGLYVALVLIGVGLLFFRLKDKHVDNGHIDQNVIDNYGDFTKAS